MKLNWGSGIGTVYIFFVIATLVMVSIFMNQDVALESNDYYEKGIKYQERIEKIKNTRSLPEQLDIMASNDKVELRFPKMFGSKEINGEIEFYRPSNRKNDFSVMITPDSTNTQKIITSSLEKGLWKVKVDWHAKAISYYDEKIIMVN
jgi:hypothetical protein